MIFFKAKTLKSLAKTILVLMVVIVIVLGPVSANEVWAQMKHPVQMAGERVLNTLMPSSSDVARHMADFVVWMNSWLIFGVQWAANIFAGTVDVADAPLREVKAITVGWTIVRDISNIFLIFVLLVIAIATILRIENYGARQLLVRLILVALLINFSLVAAQVVVDASNILGRTFLAKLQPIDVKLAAALQIGKLVAPGIDNPSTPRTAPTTQPNNTMAAIPNRGAFDEDTTNLTNQAISETGQTQFSGPTALMFINIVIFVFLILAFFVFIALSIFYVIRTIALLIIFVLAPFGFLFLTLPATRGFANKWWSKLFEWAFFYPISMFFLYLSVVWGAQIGSLQLVGNVLNAGLVFHYIAMIGLLLASVMVAKQMGIYGADAVIGAGIAARKYVTGYVGRGAKYAAKGAALGATYPVRAPVKALGRSIGDYAGRLLEQGNVPIGRGILSRIASKREEAAEKEAEKYKRLSPEQRARFAGRDPFSMSAAGQAKMFDKMNDKDKQRFMKALGPEKQIEFAKRVSRFNLTKDAAKATGNLHRAMQMIHADEYAGKPAPANNPKYRQRALDFLGDLNDQQMKGIDADSIKSEYFADYFANNARNFNDVTNTRDQIDAGAQLIENLAKRFGVNTNQSTMVVLQQIAVELRKGGNEPLARQMEGNIGINLIMNPELVGVRSRRGNVNIQTGAPTP